MAQKITRLPASEAYRVRRAAGSYYHGLIDEIHNEQAQLYLIDNCAFCFRIEYEPEKVLVIVAAEGELSAGKCGLIKAQAELLGCKSIRFHTNNDKLGRMARRWGAYPVETVYKIEV